MFNAWSYLAAHPLYINLLKMNGKLQIDRVKEFYDKCGKRWGHDVPSDTKYAQQKVNTYKAPTKQILYTYGHGDKFFNLFSMMAYMEMLYPKSTHIIDGHFLSSDNTRLPLIEQFTRERSIAYSIQDNSSKFDATVYMSPNTQKIDQSCKNDPNKFFMIHEDDESFLSWENVVYTSPMYSTTFAPMHIFPIIEKSMSESVVNILVIDLPPNMMDMKCLISLKSCNIHIIDGLYQYYVIDKKGNLRKKNDTLSSLDVLKLASSCDYVLCTGKIEMSANWAMAFNRPIIFRQGTLPHHVSKLMTNTIEYIDYDDLSRKLDIVRNVDIDIHQTIQFHLFENERFRSHLNPTIIRINDEYHGITRDETKGCTTDAMWVHSWWSCSHLVMDLNFKIKSLRPFTIDYNNNNAHPAVLRKQSSGRVFVIEDMRMMKKISNDVVLVSGACVLEPTWPDRIFRVGILEVNLKTNVIKVLKVIWDDGKVSTEKNWGFFELFGEMYMLYKTDPLIIFKFNMETFEPEEIVANYEIQHSLESGSYDNMKVSNCGNPIVYPDYILIHCKTRNDHKYDYYTFKLDFNFNVIEQLEPVSFGTVSKQPNIDIFYVNDVRPDDDNLVYSVGINDNALAFINKKITKRIRH